MYQLTKNTPLLSKKAVLTVAANKKQLMSIICNDIVKDASFCCRHTSTNKLVITGSSNVTTEIHRGVVIARPDFATSHEKADNIIVQQAVMCAKEKSNTTVVVADDTDVFVLLLYYYMKESLTSPLFMSSPVQRRSLIDIKGTVQIHQSIIPDLPAAHALSGCDTVATYFGIGKGTVLKNLIAAPNSLSQLGCLNAQLADVIDQSTQFIGACYGNRIKEKTMSDIRYRIGTTTAPKIQTLPPSTEAFVENVKRAHLQTCIWKAATSFDPPPIDPREYGYVRDEPSKTLLPTTVPDGVTLASGDIMTLIKCN